MNMTLLQKQATVLDLGLCEGRHNVPKEYVREGYIFEYGLKGNEITNVNYLDKIVADKLDSLIDNNSEIVCINLVVTGLTVALISVINYCLKLNKFKDVSLTLLHYDRDKNEYYQQSVDLFIKSKR